MEYLQGTRQGLKGLTEGLLTLTFDQSSWKRSGQGKEPGGSRGRGALILGFKQGVLVDGVSRGRCWAGIQQG